MPSKNSYQQLSRGQLRAFIRYVLVASGACTPEEAERYTGYSTRSALVTAMKAAGLSELQVAMWTRHASKSLEIYDRPSAHVLINSIRAAWAEAEARDGIPDPHEMANRWIAKHSATRKARSKADLLGTTAGLPAPAHAAHGILLQPLDVAQASRRSRSGAPCAMDYDEQCHAKFQGLQRAAPRKVGFFVDKGYPLVTTFPLKDVPLKGLVKGRIVIKPIRLSCRQAWIDSHPGSSAASIINAKADMLNEYKEAVLHLPHLGELQPVHQAGALQRSSIGRVTGHTSNCIQCGASFEPIACTVSPDQLTRWCLTCKKRPEVAPTDVTPVITAVATLVPAAPQDPALKRSSSAPPQQSNSDKPQAEPALCALRQRSRSPHTSQQQGHSPRADRQRSRSPRADHLDGYRNAPDPELVYFHNLLTAAEATPTKKPSKDSTPKAVKPRLRKGGAPKGLGIGMKNPFGGGPHSLVVGLHKRGTRRALKAVRTSDEDCHLAPPSLSSS